MALSRYKFPRCPASVHTNACLYAFFNIPFLWATMNEELSLCSRLITLLFCSCLVFLVFLLVTVYPSLLVPSAASSKPTYISFIKNWANSRVPYLSVSLKRKILPVFSVHPGLIFFYLLLIFPLQKWGSHFCHFMTFPLSTSPLSCPHCTALASVDLFPSLSGTILSCISSFSSNKFWITWEPRFFSCLYSQKFCPLFFSHLNLLVLSWGSLFTLMVSNITSEIFKSTLFSWILDPCIHIVLSITVHGHFNI